MMTHAILPSYRTLCLTSTTSTAGIQQPRHRAVDLVIAAFAFVLEHDLAVLVDDVLRRPILVAVGVPGRGIVVLRHWIGDAVSLQRGLHIGGGALEREFRRVHADHDEALVLVLGVEV